ncbi:hypothetical protein Taro_027401, partial [Colocasia esculenta]|nr:hypothetical protein [Colocasia esculenta]
MFLRLALPLMLLLARAVPAAPGFARSLGSCLLAGAVGADSRSASPGLQSSQLSRELSRAYAQQPPQYQYRPQQQAPCQQQRGQYQQQAQQFPQLQQYQPYQQQQQYPQQPPQQQQPQQAPQRGRGRGRVMALTREQAEASNLIIGTLPILGRAARVLVDPGASLCFASEEFYESLACHAPEKQCDVMVDLSSGSVDTTINGIDTMTQSKGRNVKKISSSVDTSPGQVDTREPSQKAYCSDSQSRSTPNTGRWVGCKTRPPWALWPHPQGRDMLPGRDVVATGRSSRQGLGHDDQGYRVLVATRRPCDMATMPRGITTRLLSRRVGPSRSGGRR